ncbi:MAG: alpha-mannosidase [Defluviitaleaceae bacterium]|nr:alpha-mannosidase [Defluviitaleaceae bacterium]
MNKKIHLISNAHIDPVWQWEWEEGAAEAISTYRQAAIFCEEYEGYVFCHNEAQLYRWVSEYEPTLFCKIQRLVAEGRWHIMGGWFNQPDCNMPCGEAFIRQALFGRKYFKEHFGVIPTTAMNFDSFGHSRGLVQILSKSGYDSYICWRPDDPAACPLPAEAFIWVGYDGSKIMARRVLNGYNSQLGNATRKINEVWNDTPDNGLGICLWGVGNHGGGPSRIDLENIKTLMAEAAAKGDVIVHSTLEQYFKELKEKGGLPEHRGDLNPRFPGCYTSQIKIKQLYRRLENNFFMTEKMCVHAHLLGMDYPKQELDDVLVDMMTAQFHDTLPGTSIEAVEESAIRGMYHGLEILSRVRTRAFYKLAECLPPVAKNEIPIIVYNPHPRTVEGIISCEFNLPDFNLDPVFVNATVYHNGRALPTQIEKESSHAPFQWRKRVIFRASLSPASVGFFSCKLETLPEKPKVKLKETDGFLIFNNGWMELAINAQTGWVDRFVVDGSSLWKENAFEIGVFTDTEDPWGMSSIETRKQVGVFTLLSPENGSAFSGIDNEYIPSVRVIEDGDVRTVVESVFGCNHSFAVMRYLLPKEGTTFDVEVRLQNAEKKKMLKLKLPTVFSNAVCSGEVAFGREVMPDNGRENVSQRYISVENSEKGFSVANSGIYGSSWMNGILYLTLLRSPAYTALQMEGRETMPQDRFSPYIDQGERVYGFRITGNVMDCLRDKTLSDAVLLNQPPYCLSFSPKGDITPVTNAMEISGDPSVEATALKMAEDGNGYILRLFNHAEKTAVCVIRCSPLNVTQQVTLNAFEVGTYRITATDCKMVGMMEDEYVL